MKVDYKKILNVMETLSVESPWIHRTYFLEKMESRKLKFIATIDEVDGCSRELWGNTNFQVFAKHNKSNNTYKLL